MKVLSVFGTRPEAIKMAPVVRELERHGRQIESRVCVTGQHRDMLDQVLDLFQIGTDYDLDIMRPGQSPAQVAAKVMGALEPILRAEQPDWVLVQGDTTTAAAAGLAAFYGGFKVGHVEAGPPTLEDPTPLPQEGNPRSAAGEHLPSRFGRCRGSSGHRLHLHGPSESRGAVDGAQDAWWRAQRVATAAARLPTARPAAQALSLSDDGLRRIAGGGPLARKAGARPQGLNGEARGSRGRDREAGGNRPGD